MPSSSGADDSAIRRAARSDIPHVWEMVQELAAYERLSHKVCGSAEQLERYAFDDHLVDIFVLEAEGAIQGYTISYRTFSTFRTQPGIWLEDLYVTPESRGKGYGKALLRNLMELRERNGYGRLEWSVLDWNAPAIEFYKSRGATIWDEWRLCRVEDPNGSSALPTEPSIEE